MTHAVRSHAPLSLDPLVHLYHQALPVRVRTWLHQRGISEAVITHAKLGWTGRALAIPIFDHQGQLTFFKFRRDPDNRDPQRPKYWTQPGSHAVLYGWERLRLRPARIVICEGGLDRLCLESHGIPAVTSTGGAGVFRAEWARVFQEIPEVYICFDHDVAGQHGAARVARLIPHAKIVALPHQVGVGGDVTNFFVTLGKRTEDFSALLQEAMPLPKASLERPVAVQSISRISRDGDLDRLKAQVPIVEVIGQYLPLHRSGRTLVGRCCFHDDRTPSLVVYPDTHSFYCFGCGFGGDVIRFLMEWEGLSFREALNVITQHSGVRWSTMSHKPPMR